MDQRQPRVGLFVTCLVDLFRPEIGFSTIELLQFAGCEVAVPKVQTCCGQPALNSGDRQTSQAMARQVIEAFAEYDYLVAPSGSCAAMIRAHYPSLFDDSQQRAQALALAEKSYELLSFLVDVLGVDRVPASAGTHGRSLRVTYHDSCSGLRELKVKTQARELLAVLPGVELTEMTDNEVCCGFGGTFCVKYPEISNKMVSDKIANVQASGADCVLAGDLGCLLNIAGKLKREGSSITVRHVAEVLAGNNAAPIGER